MSWLTATTARMASPSIRTVAPAAVHNGQTPGSVGMSRDHRRWSETRSAAKACSDPLLPHRVRNRPAHARHSVPRLPVTADSAVVSRDLGERHDGDRRTDPAEDAQNTGYGRHGGLIGHRVPLRALTEVE